MLAHEEVLEKHHPLVKQAPEPRREFEHLWQELLKPPPLQVPLRLQERAPHRPRELSKLLLQVSKPQP